MQTTAQLTQNYINEHPYIKNCLKKGLINYSSLARLIAKDLGIEKKSSKEAILVAARRTQEKIANECLDQDIGNLLKNSETEIKNKISVFILEKNIRSETLESIQLQIRKESGLSYLLEGSKNYTIITQNKFASIIKKRLREKILRENADMVLINIKCPKEIERVCGVISYLTSIFSENGVNIYEFISCWTDTIFIIDSNDLAKVLPLI